MAREEAIKRFKEKIATMEDGAICCDYGNDKEIFEMAIKALEQEPCEDAVSRQAVLDIDFKRIILTTAKPAEMIRQKVEQLSPVTPKPKTKWIPVSERLPEEDGRYLCTYENEFGSCVDFGKFYKGDWFVSRVTAWQPLPEPYKGSEESD